MGVSTAPVPQLRDVALSAAHPSASCLAVYVWVPVTRVELVKTANGPQFTRSGPAVVTIRCMAASGEGLLARPLAEPCRAQVSARAAEPTC